MKCFHKNGSMDLETRHGHNVIFLHYMSNREINNFSRVQSFLETFPLCENVTQTSLIKVPLLKGVWILRRKIQNIIYRSYYADNLNVMKKK